MAKKKTLYKADFSNSKQRAAEYAEAYRQKRQENKSFVEPLAKNKDYRTQQAKKFAELSGANATTNKNKTGRETITPESWAGGTISTKKNSPTTTAKTGNTKSSYTTANTARASGPREIIDFSKSRQMANSFADNFREQKRTGTLPGRTTSIYDLARQTVDDREKERRNRTSRAVRALGLEGTPLTEQALLKEIEKNNARYADAERKRIEFERPGLRNLITNQAERRNEARRTAREMYEEQTPPLRKLANAQAARNAQARITAEQIMQENLKNDKTLGQYKSTATGNAPKMDWQSSFYTDTGFADPLYDYINRNEEARSRQRLNDVKFGTTHDQYDNLDDETIREFNYIYEKSPENAYKYLDRKVGKNYTGQEAFITSLMNATGAPSLSATAAKGMARLTGNREAERRNREWYGDFMRETQGAAAQHPYAAGTGSVAGTVALISTLSTGAGAVGTAAGPLAKLPAIAKTMMSGAAVMGGTTAIQQAGAAATGYMPLGDYGRNIAISSAGGAAGAAAGSVIGARAGQIAGNILRGSKLAENQMARTLTTALVAGMSASGYSLGNTAVSETASYLRDPENYKPDMRRISRDALTAFAFGVFSYAARTGRTEGQAAPQEEFRSKFFDDCNSPQEARAKLRQYSKQYHPDMPTGDADMMARINADYAGWMNNWNATRGMEAYTRAQQAAEAGNSQEYAAAKQEFDECVNALVMQTQSGNVSAEAVEAAQILQVMSEEMSAPAANGSVAVPSMADDTPQQSISEQLAEVERPDTIPQETAPMLTGEVPETQENSQNAIQNIAESPDAAPAEDLEEQLRMLATTTEEEATQGQMPQNIAEQQQAMPAEAEEGWQQEIQAVGPSEAEGPQEERVLRALAESAAEEKENQRQMLFEAGRNQEKDLRNLYRSATMLSDEEKWEALEAGNRASLEQVRAEVREENLNARRNEERYGTVEELTVSRDYLSGEGSGRDVSLGTGESNGRIPSETGISAETSRSLTKNAADSDAGKLRILRRSKAKDLIPTAEEGQEVYLIDEEKTTKMKRGEAIVRKAGATKVTAYASKAPIRVKTGEDVRAWVNPVTLEVGYRANDEDADGERQNKHEATEIGIITGRIVPKDVAEHIRTSMAEMGLDEVGINTNDTIDAIVKLYAQGIDLDDPRIPAQVKIQKIQDATKEMICDAAAGINQFEGIKGMENLASFMDLMTTVAEPYVNEKLDYAFDEALNFPDPEEQDATTQIEVVSPDGKVNADFAQPTIIEKPNADGYEFSSTLYWNPSRKEKIRIDSKGNRTIVSAEEKSGRDYLIEMMEKNKIPKAERKTILDWCDKTARFMDRADAVYTFIGLDDIKNAKLVINPRTGNIVLKALVKNGEYPVNVDLTKECKSRIAFGKYIEYLAHSKGQQGGKNMLEEVPLTAENLVRANEILKEEGFDTACLGCFVETKRYRIKEWATSFVDKYNAAVERVNPNAEYFNFTDKDVYISDLSDEEVDTLTDDLEAYKAEKTRAITEKKEKTGKKQVGLTNEEDIDTLVRSGKSYQKKLRISDLISAEGRTALHRDFPELELIVLNHYGSATPKSIELFTPYNYELGSIERISGKKLVDYLRPVGGAREQSFSDYIVTHMMDMMEKTADMAVNRLLDQIYTKVPAAVLLFGQTKRKMNMSIMFNIDPNVSAGRAGLRADGSYFIGDRETAEKEARAGRERTFVQSFPYALAKKIQNTPGYSANCGMIGVGMSYWHNMKLLDDNDFGYIIGYHLSSMTKELAEMSHINMAADYTNVQNTSIAIGLRKVIKEYDGIPSYATWPQGIKTVENGYIAKGKADLTLDDFDFKGNLKKYGGPKTMKMFLDWMGENSLTLETKKAEAGVGSFPLYADLEKTKDPRKTADNYITWCLEKGYIPEFYEFAGHENYFNYLYDFTTYDHRTGEYSPQVPVEMVFPKNFWKIANKALNQYNNYSERQGAKERETFEKMYRDATGYKGNFSYSSKLNLDQKDKKYLQAVENGDNETAEKMVAEAAKNAGYTEELYHGTSAFGFTKFNIEKMDDGASIFATSDQKIAETYSGETRRKNISEKQGKTVEEIVDKIDNMSDEDLLPLIKENIGDKYKQVPKTELKAMRDERISDIRYYADRVMDYVDKESDETKRIVASRLASSMYKLSRAKNADEFDDYRFDYNGDLFEMKFSDEDAFYDIFDGGAGITTANLAVQELGNLMESDVMYTNGETEAGSTLAILTPGAARSKLISSLCKGIYHLYGQKTNMLDFDANGDNWNLINTSSIPNMKYRIENASDIQTENTMYTFNEAQTLAARITRQRHGENDYIVPRDIRDELGMIVGWEFSSKNSGEMILKLEYPLGKRVNTRTISEYARNAGYSGVIMRNLRDPGGNTAYSQASDIYIYFDPSQLKSADPVTYDDNGEVIPLSERFNPAENDLRYSYKLPLTEEDLRVAREINRETEKYIVQMGKIKEREYRRTQAQNLLRKARRLQAKARKSSPEFKAQVQALIGDLDTVSAGIRKTTRENLQALWDEVNAQAALDQDYAKYHATKYADLFKRLSQKQINDMSLQEIAELTEQIVALETSRKNFDKEIRKENARKLSAVANMAIIQQENIKSLKDKSELAAFFTKYGLNMLNPVRAMAMLDGYQKDGVFTGYGKELNDGQTEVAKFKMKVDKMFRKIDNNPKLINDFSKQNIEIDTIEGKTKISKGMRISLYLMLGNTKDLRHPSDNIRHIALGGINIPDETLYRKGKYKEAYTAGKIVHFAPWNEHADENTAKAIKKIVADMTPEEIEYANICKVFFNEVCKEAINEVSMQLDGYERAIVDDYFPIKSDKDFLQKNMEGLVMDATIEGLPMLKERTGGRNTILLEDASQAVLRQKNNTAIYYGLAIPVRNFTRFYNYTMSEKTKEGTRQVSSVKKAVGNTWLTAGQEYIENVIEDLQFGRQTKSSPLDAFKSLYAGTTLNFNLGVSIKQSASYPFAASVIGWKPLIKAAGKVFKKADWDYMDSITPWGYMRREGFSGTEMGEVAKQRTGIDNNQKLQKLKTSLDLIRRVDVKTTDTLFFAAEEYVKEKYPNLKVRGEEYSEKLAEVYNEVLQRTQPSYDVMQRNEFLRSQNDMVKVFGMFKTQTFNMGGELIDAGLRWKTHAEYAKKDKSYKKDAERSRKAFMGTLAATLASQMMLSVLTAVAGIVMRDKVKNYRDKKGEITPESLAARILTDFAGSFAGMTLFGGEIQSLAQALIGDNKYYDLSYPGLDVLNETMTAMVELEKEVEKAITKKKPGSLEDIAGKTANVLFQLLRLKKVPAKNIYKIVNAAYLWGQDLIDEERLLENGKSLPGLSDTSVTSDEYANRAAAAYKAGDTASGDRWAAYTTEKKLQKAMYGDQGIDEESSKAMVDYVAEGGKAEDFERASDLVDELKEAKITGDDAILYVAKSNDYTPQEKAAWLKASGRGDSKTYNAWKNAGYSDWDFIKYSGDLSEYSKYDKKEKLEKVVKYIKAQTSDKKKQKLLWNIAGYKDTTFDKNMN